MTNWHSPKNLEGLFHKAKRNVSQKSKETNPRQKSWETKQVLPSPTFNVDNQAIISFLLEKREVSGDGGYVMLLQCPNYFWPPRDCRRYLGEVTKGPCGERVHWCQEIIKVREWIPVVYTVVDKYHFFLTGLNRRNTSLSVGSQRLRPDTKVQYFGDSKPVRKK